MSKLLSFIRLSFSSKKIPLSQNPFGCSLNKFSYTSTGDELVKKLKKQVEDLREDVKSKKELLKDLEKKNGVFQVKILFI